MLIILLPMLYKKHVPLHDMHAILILNDKLVYYTQFCYFNSALLFCHRLLCAGDPTLFEKICPEIRVWNIVGSGSFLGMYKPDKAYSLLSWEALNCMFDFSQN